VQIGAEAVSVANPAKENERAASIKSAVVYHDDTWTPLLVRDVSTSALKPNVHVTGRLRHHALEHGSEIVSTLVRSFQELIEASHR